MNFSIIQKTFNLLKPKVYVAALFERCNTTVTVAKKKKATKLGPTMEKREIPVETDANKLVNYVCGSNIMKTGSDIKLKPDSEYPDWLWTLNVDRIIPLDEMDPNTKQYHRRLRKMGLRHNNKLAKLKRF